MQINSLSVGPYPSYSFSTNRFLHVDPPRETEQESFKSHTCIVISMSVIPAVIIAALQLSLHAFICSTTDTRIERAGTRINWTGA